MGCRIPGSSRRSRCSIFWEGSFERWTRRPTVSFPANSGRRGTRAPTTAGWRRRASTSPRWTSWARHKPSAWCCSGNGGLNLGRGLWVGAALAVFVHAPLAFPSTAWAQSGPSPRSPGPSHEILTARAAREAARSRWLTARWSGTLAALREAQVRWDQASETYRSVLRTAPLPAASSRRRMDAWTSVAMDLVENGEWARGLTLLRGPLASERSLVSIHALAAARLESPAAGLRVLGWPPDARSSFRAERPSARDEAQLYVAATLSDSAGSPRSARAARWHMLEERRPDRARSWARYSLARAGTRPRPRHTACSSRDLAFLLRAAARTWRSVWPGRFARFTISRRPTASSCLPRHWTARARPGRPRPGSACANGKTNGRRARPRLSFDGRARGPARHPLPQSCGFTRRSPGSARTRSRRPIPRSGGRAPKTPASSSGADG